MTDLTPPRCLDVRFRPSPEPYTPRANGRWHMPPPGLTATLRAVRRGHDTSQKIRRALRKMDERDIRKCLDSLLVSGEISQDGRRYRAVK